MGLLQPETGLLFWMLLSFIVVFVILAKYGFPVITKMVEERRVFVEKSLDAAKEAKAQLDNIKTESEALLQSAREEQMKILNEAAAAKERIISQAKNEASIEAQKQLDEAKRQIQLEKEAAVREVRSQIALLSIGIAEKVIRNKLEDAPSQMSMINRMLDEMPDMKQS